MNIFISGGSGFIGSHLATYLLKSGMNSLTIFDNFSSGKMEFLSEIINSPRLRVIKGDIKDLPFLTQAMEGADMVIHLAANPDIAKAVTTPDIDFWEGTYLTQNILESVRLNKVSYMLYTSGSGVYGERPNISFAESFGPCFPISTYGASKLACEALISSYCHMFELRARAFRFANVVGPSQTHGVGYDFLNRLLLEPGKLKILGDGSQCKSYIHIADVINAIDLVRKGIDDGPPFDVFNVATDDYITVKEIADITVEILGLKNVSYQYTGGDRGWKGDVPKVMFDVSKIKGLGWRAQYTSSNSIHASIQSMYEKLSGAAS